MVTFVPMIPTRLPAAQVCATASAAGVMMPTMGICGNFFRRSARHVALTVLQAMTIIFTLHFTRKSAISALKRRIVVTALEP